MRDLGDYHNFSNPEDIEKLKADLNTLSFSNNKVNSLLMN